jgi:hypothetical protein
VEQNEPPCCIGREPNGAPALAGIGIRGLQPAIRTVENNPDGTIKWIIEVQPKKKETIQFAFRVEYPKDKSVKGLK